MTTGYPQTNTIVGAPAGWHLPSFDDSGWPSAEVSSKTSVGGILGLDIVDDVICTQWSLLTGFSIFGPPGPFSFPDSRDLLSVHYLGPPVPFSFPDSRDLLEVLRKTSLAEREP